MSHIMSDIRITFFDIVVGVFEGVNDISTQAKWKRRAR